MSTEGDVIHPLEGRWKLHRRVALRPEPFGALAYHYDNRRLNFLRSRDLVEVVSCMGDHPTTEAAFVACGIDEQRWPSFRRALASLIASDFLEPVADPARPDPLSGTTAT
ncbi:MAG: mycofactocin biosynthesis chaperone MftB [Actinomycetia bacterium]|nr:mycofactocin biosynthesis chaperone MftB [Actinomycetes bacterium]MCP4224728.1 mycofactocin biosynthesis chaperone MftB [Actinomycetes bacterium]MCP5032192.1 mycofactocin biosynthesis chaperone MftB [Actinomycetes bacterium]